MLYLRNDDLLDRLSADLQVHLEEVVRVELVVDE
jgi:hypothetical protein